MSTSQTPSTDLPLKGKKIIVGVCAGIAAYKAILVVRQLSELGADVRVIPTSASLNFVGKATWEAISHNPVTTSVFEEIDQVAHVKLGHEADAALILPATADFLARARMGRADDLLTASLLVVQGPVIMAPAMHTQMLEHPATVDNLKVLKQRGVRIIEPGVGRLTGEDYGPGRLAEPETIVSYLLATLANGSDEKDLLGKKIVITAGGTREALDPVRVLTNHSSGKQGLALAYAAQSRGAEVTLISANVTLAKPSGMQIIEVDSAAALAKAVKSQSADSEVLIMAAAVSDFTVNPGEAKLKKDPQKKGLELSLIETEDVLHSAVLERASGKNKLETIIGFAAETGSKTQSALSLAQEKARRKGADLICFNDLSVHNFGSSANSITLLNSDGEIIETASGSSFSGTKYEVAHFILDQLSAK